MNSSAKRNPPIWDDARERQKPSWNKLSRFLNTKLNHNNRDNRPKYKVLQDGLSDAIRKGVISDNELLPTESALTNITPFSLGTVQRALQNLVSAGLIVRKAGVGTIVAPWRRELENPLHTKFMNEEGDLLPVYTEVLSRRRVSGSGPWQDFLKSHPHTLEIKRRLILERPDSDGGDFSYYNAFYVDASKFTVFRTTPKRDLNGVNFKRMMAEEFNLAITRVSNHMGIFYATTDIAVALAVDVGSPLLRQRVFAHSMNRPLYYQEYWVPPYAQEIVIDTALDTPIDI